MKDYIEIKGVLANVGGKRTWVDPKPTGKETRIDEKTAEIINGQAEASGIVWMTKEQWEQIKKVIDRNEQELPPPPVNEETKQDPPPGETLSVQKTEEGLQLLPVVQEGEEKTDPPPPVNETAETIPVENPPA